MNTRIFIIAIMLAVLACSFSGVLIAEEAKAAHQPYPHLPVVEWNRNEEVNLENFRGQITVLIFFNDSES